MAGKAKRNGTAVIELTEALSGAIVHETPVLFEEDGGLDPEAFTMLVPSLAAERDFLLVNSALGEALSLSARERQHIAKLAVGAAASGRIIVDVTTFSTRESVALAVDAERAGAAAVLIASPYYWHLTNVEWATHVGTVANSISLPVIVATGRDAAPPSFSAMAAAIIQKHRNVAGVVYRGTGFIPAIELGRRLRNTSRPLALIVVPSVAIALAHDHTVGLLASTGSVNAAAIRQVVTAGRGNDAADNSALISQVVELERVIDGNPARLKHVAAWVGRSMGKPRPPLVPLDRDESTVLDAELIRLGIGPARVAHEG